MWAKESYDYYANKVRTDTMRSGVKETIMFDFVDEAFVRWKYTDSNNIDYDCSIEKIDDIQSSDLDLLGFKVPVSETGPTTIHSYSVEPLVAK